MSDIPGMPARRAAKAMIEAVMVKRDTLDVAERNALRNIRGNADRALARAIANEVLRWLADLDALIDSATSRVLNDDAKPRHVLRLMLAQWLRLETPPHAIIATALPLLTGGQRRLAHGVFSNLVKREVKLPDAPTLPDAVQMRWGDLAQDISPGLAVPPALDLALRDHSETERRMQELGGISLMPGHVRLPRGIPVEQLPGYEEGAWWVQDLAASLPARLLGAGNGRRVLDLCAAPGGKTLQLAAAGWEVTALDNSEKRLKRLRENLERTGLEAEIIVADALGWQPAKEFDAILLDAPCSATGTCRRHPDVLHRIDEQQIFANAEKQHALLTRAAEWLPAGGELVYAVCSLEHAEGEAQMDDIDLTPVPVTQDDLPQGIAPSADGWLRTHPGMLSEHGGLDGFFAARWRR